MNHFVYNLLNAISYNISYKSFIIAKKWISIGLFSDVIAIFSLSSFKTLSDANKQKIYDKILELRDQNIDVEYKKKWLITCKEQLENLSFLETEEIDLTRSLKNKRKE